MTVAILTDGIFPFVIGGMQRHSFYLAKFLASQGVEVDLYHVRIKDMENSGVDVFSEMEGKHIRSFAIEFPDFGKLPGHYIRESYEFSVRIWNVFKNEKRPDFIIAKGFAGWELLNQKRRGVSLPPVGLNFHGYEMFQKQPGLIAWLKGWLLLRSPVLFNVKNADYLFSYGAKITSIISNLGVDRKKIIEIPTGISEEWMNNNLKLTSGTRKFIFVGRFERRKGVEELTSVLKNLIKQSMKFEFHFVGPVPTKMKIANGNIFYHGMINDNEKMKELLREMDILVCPSHAEGMPNVIMEGMASGLTIIATDTGATSVMVNQLNGWLISPGNKNELLNAMKDSLTLDRLEIDKKKNFSLSYVKENFLWNKIAELTIKEIKNRIVSF